MYGFIVALSLFAASTLAAVPGLPACAGDCLNGYGGCSQYNVTCICSNEPLIADLTCCVSQKCNSQQVQEVISFADALCAGQGGVTNLPTAATCASTGAATTTGGSSTSSMSMSSGATASTKNTVALTTISPTNTQTSSAASGGSSSSAAAAATGTNAANMNNLDKYGIGMVVAGLVAAI